MMFQSSVLVVLMSFGDHLQTICLLAEAFEWCSWRFGSKDVKSTRSFYGHIFGQSSANTTYEHRHGASMAAKSCKGH